MVSQGKPRESVCRINPSCVTNRQNPLSKMRMFARSVFAACFVALLRNTQAESAPEVKNEVIVSVRDQKLMLLQNGARVTTYPVSTSKFGVGDSQGRMTTPIGNMAVAQKIGDHAPVGAVFHNRRFRGRSRPKRGGASARVGIGARAGDFRRKRRDRGHPSRLDI